MLLAGAAVAQSDEAPEVAEEPAPVGEEDPLTPYRARFDELAERTIGTVSKPVAFNWRRTKVHLAAAGAFPFELNNFNSARVGGMARFPTGGALIELQIAYVKVWDTPSSRLLAFTPYRQPGRPTRLELDVGLAYPLAEGVVTAFPRFFPAVELVFNAYFDFRYLIHPAAYQHMKPGKVITAILSPRLSEDEVDNMDNARLDAMKMDTGRYGLMAGFGNDVYFEQGLFLSPRVMVAVPILAPASGTELYVWAELSMAIGVAF